MSKITEEVERAKERLKAEWAVLTAQDTVKVSVQDSRFAALALACMEALLEPSEGMVEAGEVDFFEFRPAKSAAQMEATRNMWRAMMTRAMGRDS